MKKFFPLVLYAIAIGLFILACLFGSGVKGQSNEIPSTAWMERKLSRIVTLLESIDRKLGKEKERPEEKEAEKRFDQHKNRCPVCSKEIATDRLCEEGKKLFYEWTEFWDHP